MIEILIKGLASGYEVEHLARVFYAGAPLRKTKNTKGDLLYAVAGHNKMVVAIRIKGQCFIQIEQPNNKINARLQLCNMLYHLLQNQTGQTPPWGMLTGVRPVNFLRHALMAGEKAAKQEMVEEYRVSEEKYTLATTILKNQQPFIDAIKPNSYSLYVSIPFCPTRCSYCSFVSRTLEKEASLVDTYLQRLKQELQVTAQVAKECGLQLDTIYVGGGTPTALNAQQLEFLLQSVELYFDTKRIKEYTVEAGRPDCTNFEKLKLLKEYGVSRISINPQTMNDSVLQAIQRNHTAADIVRCINDARNAGHTNINMDLIAGLPNDYDASFANTMQQILSIEPENITIHTLTLKRASNIVVEHQKFESSPANMLIKAYPLLEEKGYQPYYLYRQKNTVENFENTGWAKKGTEGLYNIFIMEEAQTILAVGAGASTKMVNPITKKIERIYNYKYPAEYIQGIENMLQRKKGVIDFYGSNMDPKALGGHWVD